jgi:hypothetical protein
MARYDAPHAETPLLSLQDFAKLCGALLAIGVCALVAIAVLT